MLPEIKRQNIYEQVIAHLQQYIIANSLKPGDRLPTEMELAEQFRVSRHTVREAMKVLESVGVLETRPRDGCRLRQMSTRPLTGHLRFLFELDGVTVREMASARHVIECGIVPMFIENAEESHFQRMATAIEQMEALTQCGKTFAAADSEFHQTLASATKNRVMEGFGQMLQDFFAHLQPHIHADEALQLRSIAEHRQIYAALRDKDAVAAQQVIEEHLSVYNRFATNSTFWSE